MPARSKGARLWLRRARRDRKTGESHNAVWIIRDGKHTEGTGCRKDDRTGAERALAEYLNRKHLEKASKGTRDPSQVPIADVLAFYGKAKGTSQSRPRRQRAGSPGYWSSLAIRCFGTSTAICAARMSFSGRPTLPPDANWRIFAPRSTIIDERGSAPRLSQLCCLTSALRASAG